MANPLQFEPKKVDPRLELQNRLDRAPIEHAEALLVAYDLLGEAHSQGILDLLLGAVGSKNAIFGKIAEYAKEPVSTQAMRNGIAMLRLLGSIDPDMLLRLTEALTPPIDEIKIAKHEDGGPERQTPVGDHRNETVRRAAGTRDGLKSDGQNDGEKKVPSLWQLFKRITSEDARRGLDVATTTLTGFGKAMK